MCIECICVYILPLLPLHYTHTLTSNPLVSTHIHITHTHTHPIYRTNIRSDSMVWYPLYICVVDYLMLASVISATFLYHQKIALDWL